MKSEMMDLEINSTEKIGHLKQTNLRLDDEIQQYKEMMSKRDD